MVTYFQIPVRSSMSVFESLELKQKKQNTLRMSSAFQYCCLLRTYRIHPIKRLLRWNLFG